MNQMQAAKAFLKQKTGTNGHSIQCVYDDDFLEARFICRDCREGFGVELVGKSITFSGTSRSCYEVSK